MAETNGRMLQEMLDRCAELEAEREAAENRIAEPGCIEFRGKGVIPTDHVSWIADIPKTPDFLIDSLPQKG